MTFCFESELKRSLFRDGKIGALNSTTVPVSLPDYDTWFGVYRAGIGNHQRWVPRGGRRRPDAVWWTVVLSLATIVLSERRSTGRFSGFALFAARSDTESSTQCYSKSPRRLVLRRWKRYAEMIWSD